MLLGGKKRTDVHIKIMTNGNESMVIKVLTQFSRSKWTVEGSFNAPSILGFEVHIHRPKYYVSKVHLPNTNWLKM